MAHTNQILLTVIVVIVAIVVVLWLLQSFKHDKKDKHCFGPKPDPVGGIKSKKIGPGLVEISWDKAPNATSYRVFINDVNSRNGLVSSKINLKNSPNHPLVACGDSDCCPQECDECVSQSNYKKVVETCETCITVQTCEPEICFIVVPYNKCGQAGKCKEIKFAEVDCVVNDISCWVVNNDCRGLELKWNCHECCETVHIYVNGQHVDSVPCCDEKFTSEGIGCCDELAIQCESRCGLGEMLVIIPGCPEGVQDRSFAESVAAQKQAATRRISRNPKPRVNSRLVNFTPKSRSNRRKH